MSTDLEITVVSPVYEAADIVDELVRQLTEQLSQITPAYEIILVEDGSADDSWQAIVANAKKDQRVKGIKLSRNFGQHFAITAGLKFVRSEWIVVMDCDLQDRPDEIVNLYKKSLEGYDIVFARRMNRKDSPLRLFLSDVNHFVFSKLSGLQTDRSSTNFGIYRKNVIAEINNMPEVARSFLLLVNHLGFKKTELQVKHSERFSGNSSYSFSKLFAVGMDNLLANSNRPLHLTVNLGFAIALLSFGLALYNLFAYYTGRVSGVPGFTTTVFSIWFTCGIVVFTLGIIGTYIGKIYDQVKSRPLYVIQDVVNI